MACGIVGAELMLRLGEDGGDAAFDERHVRPMDFTGKPMRSMVFVEPAASRRSGSLAIGFSVRCHTGAPGCL